MAVSKDMHLYLSSPVTDTLYAIDLYGDEVPVPITGITDCWELALSPDGHRLYAPSIAADGSGELTEIDTQTLRVTTRVALPQVVTNVTSAPDGSRLYLTTADSVLVWDTASSRVLNGALSSTASAATDGAQPPSGVPCKDSVITGWAAPNLPPAAR
jgi:hypothetical protein